MVYFATPVVLLLSLATYSVGLSPPFAKRTVAQVQADIADISSKVTALDNAITSFPSTGGSLITALAIHNSAVALIGTLKTGTSDVIATGPVGETDAQGFLTSVQAIEPTIKDSLVQIVNKKPAFQALPIGGLPALILQDLKYLKGNTTAFSDALISAAPADLRAQATALRDDIVAAFDPAIAAYS